MKEEAQSMTGLSRRSALLAALGVAAVPAIARAATGAGGWSGVAAAANAVVAGKHAPGIQVAVMKKGAVVYSKGFGLANLETGTPVGATSIFRIGSVTKQFTAAALLQLQEAGLVSVDDKLAKYLPEVQRANEVTLRQMLNHTSGIGNYTNTGKVEIFLQRSRVDYPQADLLKAMMGTDPMFIGEPGAQWEYSNTAFVLLGLVIEKVTGKPFAETFKPNLFARAGLTHTAVDDNAEVVPGRCSGYSPNATAPSGFENASYISMTYPGAAGNMRSTAEDLCKWHQALFGGKILKPASLAEMTRPGLLANGKLPTAKMGPGEAKPVKYGMGLFMDSDAHGQSISHGGGIQGFGSWIGTYPDAGPQISYIVNADGGYDGKSHLGEATKAVRDAAVAAAFA